MTDPRSRIEASFERNFRDVAAYCRRRCPSPEDAEEAATEVFAIAWRRVAELPDPPDDRLWLFGAARRVVANQQRAARRRERLEARLRSERGPASVAAPLDDGFGESAAARALRALPEGDRELLLLVAWEGLSPGEIARVVDRPAPVVSMRLHRARKRFAHVYDTAEARAVGRLRESST